MTTNSHEAEQTTLIESFDAFLNEPNWEKLITLIRHSMDYRNAVNTNTRS